jgi:hypothetical protein
MIQAVTILSTCCIVLVAYWNGCEVGDIRTAITIIFCCYDSFTLRRAWAVPSADVFNRISKALEVSPDYLLNGTIQDKAKNNIQDNELLLQFEKVEKLNDQKKSLVKEFLDAFILKANLQQQLS